MTLVWGLAMVGEFVVRIVLVLTLSVVQVLALSQVVMMVVSIGLGVWNVAFGVRVSVVSACFLSGRSHRSVPRKCHPLNAYVSTSD